MRKADLSGKNLSLSFPMMVLCLLSVCCQADIFTTGQVINKNNTIQLN